MPKRQPRRPHPHRRLACRNCRGGDVPSSRGARAAQQPVVARISARRDQEFDRCIEGKTCVLRAARSLVVRRCTPSARLSSDPDGAVDARRATHTLAYGRWPMLSPEA
eukprot:302760-Prymnesium_polylepis.1